MTRGLGEAKVHMESKAHLVPCKRQWMKGTNRKRGRTPLSKSYDSPDRLLGSQLSVGSLWSPPSQCHVWGKWGSHCIHLALPWFLFPVSLSLSLDTWSQPLACTSGSFMPFFSTLLRTFSHSPGPQSRTTPQDRAFPHDYSILLLYEILSWYTSRASVGLIGF